MKALVTGGAGFIGSHLCEALIGLGHEVVAVDNFITGHPHNVAHLTSSPRFRLVELDIAQPLEDDGWELVCHFASPASPVGYMKHPVETLLVNSVGTYNLLELAKHCGAQFVLASTSEVYGDPREHPQRESYWGNVNPIGPRACYDEGKRFAEAMTITYLKQYDLDVRIARIFNTYGPRNDPRDGRVIPNFVTQAVKGEPITVYGDGLQTRSLCYVTDMIQGILHIIEHPSIKGEVFNLGSPDERPIIEVANLIKRLSGSSSPIVHQPPREEEISQRRPDISKAKAILGWSPRYTLEEGLHEAIVWFKALQDK